MSTGSRRQKSSASRPNSARQRELNTKRRGELGELAFTLKAATLGFGVSKPFGDSERYDVIVDSRELAPTRRCNPACPILQAAQSRKARVRAEAFLRPGGASRRQSGTVRRAADESSTSKRASSRTLAPSGRRLASAGGGAAARRGISRVPSQGSSDAGRGCAPGARPEPSDGVATTEAEFSCPALRRCAPHPWCPPHPTPLLWRVQIKCSTQLANGLYHLNAHRRTGGRAVPYLPGEIDFLAAYVIPEDTWYIIPLEAFLGSTSLLFRRRNDPKPGLYDQYREAWHLLRPSGRETENRELRTN